MKSRITRVTVAATGTLAALAIGLTSASAATLTYTVTAGTAASGASVPLTGTTTGATPQVSFTDTTAGLPLTCDSSSVPGTTKVGKGLPAAKLATIMGGKAKFTNCKGPFGLAFVVTGAKTWSVNAKGATVSGSTPGTITGVSAKVADGTTCVFTVTGSVAGSYKNGSSKTLSSLILPGTTSTLTLSGVSGSTCSLAGIKNGDKASFKGTYQIKANTTASNPVNIISR